MTTERLCLPNTTRAATILGRGPWLTLTLVCLAYSFGSNPQLELDRASVLAGEWWRLVSGHFVHYGLAHSRGDIWAFFVWATLIEAISRRLFAISLCFACGLIGVGVLLFCPTVGHYAGLSGVDVALFVVILCVAWSALPRARGCVAICALGLAAKTGYEVLAQRAILAPDLGAGVFVLPAAHALGAVAGLLAFELTPSVAEGEAPPDR